MTQDTIPETSPLPAIAAPWRRIAALVLDCLLVAIVLAPVTSYAATVSLRWWVAMLPVALISFLIYQVTLHALFGATLGKRILRIRVVRQDDLGPINLNMALRRSFVDAVLRLSTAFVFLQILRAQVEFPASGDVMALAKLLQTYPAYAALSDITGLWTLPNLVVCLFNPRHRAIHDWIGGTVVVRVRKSTPG